ncbi:Uu.00g053520.m01.CDS01 [Anthostomella pinea]|uniref:amidase n=1 Tax=Anthostomella pinea TaxID=933095 RepID=A0AAI8VWE2_9PEZI|nr:Uu.00g053520.m01.CDS01 [Anthostomella pinea]
MAPASVTTASGATWQEVAADRQRHRDATLDQLCPPLPKLLTDDIPLNTTSIPGSLLTEEELGITGTAVEDLAAKIASGEWSSTTVVNAFLRRAAMAQKLVNCVTEILPERALKRAAELNAYLATHKKPMGPLHGVPISVKEHVGMKGLDLNAGFVGWVGNVADEDALILRCLWEAGAVFYVRTTQPQTLMHLETSNNLYGTTINPYNSTLTSGGSSGGEGALLGLRGSVLGIGTDIGGSIRSPAANNGVFGFKPTSLRLPVEGLAVTMAGAEHIRPTPGPLSTSVEGLRLFTKAILDRKPWLRDPTLVPLGWRDVDGEPESRGRKLRVAVVWDDGVVRPHPPVVRALADVVEKLRASEAVEVVEWKPWRHDLAWEIIAKLYFCDGGAEEAAAIDASGEPWRPLSKWIIRDNPHVRAHTIPSLWKAIQERDAYKAKYAELWNANATTADDNNTSEVDVILCPAGPGVAPKLETARYWGYTSQWNLLDYPAVVFPVGGDAISVEKDGDGQQAEGAQSHAYPEDYTPLSEADAYNWALWKEHGAAGYRDAPVSLQLVGRRYEDEKLLRALENLLDAAGLPRSC